MIHMGMYDKEPNFEDAFKAGDRFVVTGMKSEGSISTVHGKAERVSIQIVSRDHPSIKRTYSMLGNGFASQARRAEASDFPHVAEYVRKRTGHGENEVKLLARVDVDPRAFIEGDDGPPLDIEEVLSHGGLGIGESDEDLGF